MVTDEELRDRVAHHPPRTEARVEAHEIVRTLVGDLLVALNHMLPESREKALALTTIQEACMWANAALAIHEDG